MTAGPCSFREGDLDFAFDASWTLVSKWDDAASYRKGVGQVEGTTAVDFIGLRADELFFLEVKDYRASERTPPTRQVLRDGGSNLVTVVASKLRDSVAGIVGAGRLDRDSDTTTLLRHLADTNTRVWAILWIEHAATLPGVKPRVQNLRNRARGGVELDRLQAAVRWLGARALICSRDDRVHIDGLSVRSTAGATRRTGH
ncbi:MAG: hypothetical protein JNL82_15605 [Myxococcales bacterium]|nr:hypothetical protein [Myxococcales bacterium]